jgi:hypothetical protein
VLNTANTFRSDESGAVTVETVIWLPVFFAAALLVADVSYLFTVNASMWEAARVGAREAAMHRAGAEGAERAAENLLISPGKPYEITGTVDDRYVEVVVSLPVSDAGLTGIITGAISGDLRARVEMGREPG